MLPQPTAPTMRWLCDRVARSLPRLSGIRWGQFSSQVSVLAAAYHTSSSTPMIFPRLRSQLGLHAILYGNWPNRRIDPCFPALDFTVSTDDHHPRRQTCSSACRVPLRPSAAFGLPEGIARTCLTPLTSRAILPTSIKPTGSMADWSLSRTIVVLAPKLPKRRVTSTRRSPRIAALTGEPWIQLIRPPLSEPPLTQAELTRPHIGGAAAE